MKNHTQKVNFIALFERGSEWERLRKGKWCSGQGETGSGVISVPANDKHCYRHLTELFRFSTRRTESDAVRFLCNNRVTSCAKRRRRRGQLYLCRNVAANCLVNIYTRPIIYLWQIEKVETLTSQIWNNTGFSDELVARKMKRFWKRDREIKGGSKSWSRSCSGRSTRSGRRSSGISIRRSSRKSSSRSISRRSSSRSSSRSCSIRSNRKRRRGSVGEVVKGIKGSENEH